MELHKKIWELEKDAIQTIEKCFETEETYRVKLLMVKQILKRLEKETDRIGHEALPSSVFDLLPF